jgi:hypothetical protein
MDALLPMATATFEEQDAGSGPIHASPMCGPMTAAIHNISARNLHELNLSAPDDRQFLRSWRKQLQDCMNQQNVRIIKFLLADGPAPVSGASSASSSSASSSGSASGASSASTTSASMTDMEITQRCLAVLNKYSKPTWSFTSSIKDLALSTASEIPGQIETELGISPVALRDYLKKAIRLYVNSASALSAAEGRLEEKLKRLEAVSQRINDLMFMEPTSELEQLGNSTRVYLDSVLEKIDLENDFKELTTQFKKFTTLRPLLSLGTFQRAATTAPTCSICMTREISQAVTPCGHTFCEDCCRNQMTACYICRVQIRDKIKLYFA